MKKNSFVRKSEVRWVSECGRYSIMLLPGNEFRSERSKFRGQHVLLEDAKEQCEFLEGAE